VRILFQKSNLKELYENLLYDSHFDEHVLDDTQNILFRSFQSISRECDALSDVDTFIKKFLSLEFVVIVSPSDEDAYQLFEGLNSTGLSLSAVELTKKLHFRKD
jgi:hypothetical protein